ncbi:hypothetical protein GNI_081870 [Gregarina niphandrodes]|uniref:Uncharacterized protein n=1 Tax=Gregarina niphandrodes TaxID=110365 RepID=A0A023B6A9_GRENI|nr:hypothetical protein GNI_081870 [Gregarina niphandrodes]EZG65886.1 hypothetical protein GNI_081870 [Gregarina niphandrodes]|eukprot:XP_011134044.1 hypothetical protein GNI_081870 [Gregarina niphandrodes]
MRGPVVSTVGFDTAFATLAATVLMSHGLFTRNRDDDEVYLVGKKDVAAAEAKAVLDMRRMLKQQEYAWKFNAHIITVAQLREACDTSNAPKNETGAPVQLRKADVSLDSRRRVLHYWHCWTDRRPEQLFQWSRGKMEERGTDMKRRAKFNFHDEHDIVLVLEKRRDPIPQKESQLRKREPSTVHENWRDRNTASTSTKSA